MSISTRKQELIQELESLQEWEDKYLYIIDLAKKLPELPDHLKNERNRVFGCTSRVWLVGEKKKNGELELQAASDSQVVKGLAAILIKIYSGCSTEQVLQDHSDLVTELGIAGGLMPTRVIGFEAMRKKIQEIVAEF